MKYVKPQAPGKYRKLIIRGTKTVSTIPLKTAIKAYSFPEYFTITDRFVSMEVAPPQAMGASFQKYLDNNGLDSEILSEPEF
jgi:hypothetical protein